ncbi:MAG: prolyl oligopeptidase family serine peptidase [Myxococcota bacterium]
MLRKREGFHHALAVGPNGAAVVESEGLGNKPRVQVLAASGERILPSRVADAEAGPVPEIVELQGERMYHAAVTKPPGLKAGQKVPGLFYVYGGPTSVTVDRRGSRLLLDRWLARAGFVVFRIDGRGTPRRGRDWNRAISGDLFSAPLEDYVEAVALLGEKVPELDTDRIGIFGWSFGGYASAMSVMREPGVFHAAVAGAPVVDWGDYDTHYTERYLGVPEDRSTDPAYRVSDVLTYAESLRRPLMVVHGTADDNVFFIHTTRLSDALTKAGRMHRVVPIANETHSVKDPERVKGMYLSIVQFFRESLENPSTTLDTQSPRLGARAR